MRLDRWLPGLTGIVALQINGVQVAEVARDTINFIGDLSAEDDPDNGRTNLTFSADAGSIAGKAVASGTPSDGNMLEYSSGTGKWELVSPSVVFTAGGDLSGTSTAQTVAKIQGVAVSASGPSLGNIFYYNGSQWTPGTLVASSFSDGTITYARLNLSAGAIPYAKLTLTGAVTNADLAGSIAYSKLSLTGAILNADLAGSIAYSKLSLTGAILNADLAGGITYAKLSLSAGDIPYSKLALTGAILNADLAGSIAYGKLALTGAILNADLAGSIAYSKLSLTGAILNADLAGSIAYSKLSLTGAILNADLAGSIAYSKLSLTGAILNADLAGSIAYSKLSLSGAILNADLAGSIAFSKLVALAARGEVYSNSAGVLTIFNRRTLAAGASVAVGDDVSISGVSGACNFTTPTSSLGDGDTILFKDTDLAGDTYALTIDGGTKNIDGGRYYRIPSGGAIRLRFNSTKDAWEVR